MPIAANTIIPASIGVEQGVPANANAIPNNTGYTNNELVLFCGMDLIIMGISKSRIPVILKPITSKSDAIISVKYPPKTEAKTLPVIAQIIPIIVNTTAVPKMKLLSWINVLNGVSFEQPPTYPIIKGSMAREQGDIDAITPPKKEDKNIKNQLRFASVPVLNIDCF